MNNYLNELNNIKRELDDADVANIKAAGLRLVCKPDVKPSNVVSLYPARRFVEPMDAA